MEGSVLGALLWQRNLLDKGQCSFVSYILNGQFIPETTSDINQSYVHA
jgi:hypothetical protein